MSWYIKRVSLTDKKNTVVTVSDKKTKYVTICGQKLETAHDADATVGYYVFAGDQTELLEQLVGKVWKEVETWVVVGKWLQEPDAPEEDED